jgi:atypical dual specificity phosphatase
MSNSEMSLYHYLFDKAYPLIRFTYEKIRRQAWFTQISDDLWLGGAPTYLRDYEFLRENGIGAVLDMRWERSADLDYYNTHDIHYQKVKVFDVGVPTLAQMEDAVAFVRENVEAGRPVLIHCAKGRGRSGVVLMAYLMRYEGMTFEAARDWVKAKRSLLKQEMRHKIAAEKWLATHAVSLRPVER